MRPKIKPSEFVNKKKINPGKPYYVSGDGDRIDTPIEQKGDVVYMLYAGWTNADDLTGIPESQVRKKIKKLEKEIEFLKSLI